MPATVEAKTPAATTSKIIPPIMNELLMFRAALADSVHELSKGRLLRGGHSRGKEEGAL